MIELNNTVYCEGEGVPLVLVHAFPVDHRMWDGCAGRLIALAAAQGDAALTIWAPDMPGAGEGPIPDAHDSGRVDTDGAYLDALDNMTDAYAQLVRDAGYERAVWAGLSMGGYVVMDMQRRHPDMIAGVALCDTKTSADSADARAHRIAVAEQCERDNNVDAVMGFAQASESDSSFKRSAGGSAMLARWIASQPPRGIAWRQRMAAGREDLTDQLANISVPAAVVGGDKDPFSPPAAMEELAAAMTSTKPTFTMLEDCAHFSAVEHPDEVAHVLLDLMRRVRAGENA
ncbi:alpha/beta hydrolase [Bifidobacterium goeldii]|uniref:Alpha/beta hydrolase n=1 Tax=Bifidobacterium goeldii TaxID=2306975 RepID=A0A430FKL4_9BIFI|nr:alpha/beta hydrolase [Bifidobacterium goeldii]RSX53444.1 alpha/beta hydrolase [Bifidobacterium goeldii]